jgi:hypothetical protein
VNIGEGQGREAGRQGTTGEHGHVGTC